MSTKKCGTCLYFEDAGMASSGWCRHPNRVDIQNLVLVRKSELACRNSWDQDLWKDGSLVGANGIPKPLYQHEHRASNDDSRSTIAVDSPVETQAFSSKIDQVYKIDLVPVRKNDDQANENANHSTFPESKKSNHFSRKPRFVTYSHEAQPQAQEPSPVALETSPEFSPDSAVANDREEDNRHDAESVNTSQPNSKKTYDWTGGNSSRPRDEVRPADNAQQTEPLPQTTFRSHSYRSISTGSNDLMAPFVTLESKNSKFQPVPRPVQPIADDQISSPEQLTIDTKKAVDPPPDSIDPIYQNELLDGVAKCCGTCLDFIPSGDGTTGTCTNAYAFSAHRMVKSDELACRTSIGVWWLPNNDIVHDKARIGRHTRPTPYFDSYLNRRR